ncbi:MAG: hypothetical protein ACTSQI_13300 [Candidatus Helarchaeota archaeon]
MEKIIEVTEEIEKKGLEILSDGEEKAKEIFDLVKKKIEQLRIDAYENAQKDLEKLEQEFQQELNQEIEKLKAQKDKILQRLQSIDLSEINIDELIHKEILEL